MKKEDELMHWLEAKGLPADQQVVETFTEAGFTGEDLETFSDKIPKDELAQILLWIENLLSSQRIIKDLGEASTRISNLVGAIKSHVHMDRTNEMQPTDIHNDIENTLTLLGYKLREKNITVKKNFVQILLKFLLTLENLIRFGQILLTTQFMQWIMAVNLLLKQRAIQKM